jgi:AcrR family transcriptional regulator
MCHTQCVPKLWTETIDAHRTAVRDATLDTTAALVAKHGLAGVTMSQIAKETGIGRATLYKYYPDVQAIMIAWHERQITAHLDQLVAVRDHTQGTASQRLEAVLTAFAQLSRQQHDTELAALLHRGEHVARAQQHLRQLISDLIAAGAREGDLRNDVAPAELATYCLYALTAAGSLSSQAAVRRLISVTLSGLRAASSTTAPPPSR